MKRGWGADSKEVNIIVQSEAYYGNAIIPGFLSPWSNRHYSRVGHPSILRQKLRPGVGVGSASLSMHSPYSYSRRGQPSLLRGSLRPGIGSASLSIQPWRSSSYRQGKGVHVLQSMSQSLNKTDKKKVFQQITQIMLYNDISDLL